MNPFWTTFYSYKGGVGRSMAVANVACTLARQGRKVLLIDFDLEAPGLDSFEEFKNCSSKPGVVEYVDCYIKTGKPAPIDSFIHNCTNNYSSPGKIWVMPSGDKKEGYSTKLSSIDWNGLYNNQNGSLFFENWKSEINKKYRPDYVIVDSRTGLTDVGGICTLQFPDLVVLMFALNNQNIEGISKVSKAIQNAPVTRTPQIHYVASPLPPLTSGKADILNSRFEVIKSELGIDLKEMSIIRYSPEVAIRETIFESGNGVEIPIFRDYKNLSRKIQKFNRSGIDFLKSQVDSVIEQQNKEKAISIDYLLSSDYNNIADSYYLRYKLKPLVSSNVSTEELLLECLEKNPQHEEAFKCILSLYNSASVSQPYKIVDLCNRLLPNVDKSRGTLLRLQLGNALMGCDNYAEALHIYENLTIQTNETSALLNRSQELVVRFNAIESMRRLGKTVPKEKVLDTIKMYEAIGQTEATLDIQANRLQAMHIPYFLSGNIPKAKELLYKAEASARALSELDEIFTVAVYRNVNQVEFLAINSQMIASLSMGYLFDDPSRPEK